MLGSNVQVTLGAALNVAAFAGGIGGDYISASALEVYDAATLSYWLQQPGSPRPWASLRVGNVDIYQAAASIVNRVRLQSPNALAASYALTLPVALPASLSLLQVDNAGSVTATNSPTIGGAVTVTGLLTASSGVTAAVNQNVTVSGTGMLKHGTRTVLQTVCIGDIAPESGTAAVISPSPSPGVQFGANCNAYIPVRSIHTNWTISSIDFVLGNTPAASVTYTAYTQNSAAGSTSFVTTGVSTSGTATTGTIPVNSAFTTPVWIKISVPGTAFAIVKTIAINYSVP
jgi:hypothetical protein